MNVVEELARSGAHQGKAFNLLENNLSDRILRLLDATPGGLTAKEVADRLGTTPGNVSSILSKLAAYGRIQQTWGQAAASARRAAIYGVTRDIRRSSYRGNRRLN